MSSTTNVGTQISLMSAYAALKGQSAEELRVVDYLAAYTTTGKPPLPCPQEPIDPKQRASLNLPPLFEPHIEYEHIPTLPNAMTSFSNGVASSSNINISGRPQELPTVQLFRPQNDNGETPQSISLQPEFSHYSHEELRHDAYIRGNKKVDLPAGHTYYYPPLPVSQPPSSASQPPPLLSVPSQFPVPVEIFISMSAQPSYAQHSVEELRLAYLKAGRDVTSAEIHASSPILPSLKSGSFNPPPPPPAAANPASLSRSILFSNTNGGAFARSPQAPF